MGHTKGPFRILHRSDRSIDRTHDGKIIITDDRLFFIASVHADADEHETVEQEEQLANAHLLKAAPDLLTALETYQAVLAELQSTGFSSTAIAAWTRLGQADTRAQHAIQKAKGE